MTSAVTRVRRTVFGVIAAGAACATLGVPAAGADPEDTLRPRPRRPMTATPPPWRRPSAR